MKYASIFLIFIGTLLSFQSIELPDNDWKLEKIKNDIQVYSRLVEGSPIKEGRFIFTVEANLSSVVALLLDVDSYADWSYRNPFAEVIETDHQGNMTYYSIGDFPWPFYDRDAVIALQIYQDIETGIVYYTSSCVKGVKAPVEELVRVDLMDTNCIIESQGNGIIKIDYRVQIDPGGYMPSWLINLFFDKGPIHYAENLREYIKKPKYRDIDLPYIDDDLR